MARVLGVEAQPDLGGLDVEPPALADRHDEVVGLDQIGRQVVQLHVGLQRLCRLEAVVALERVFGAAGAGVQRDDQLVGVGGILNEHP